MQNFFFSSFFFDLASREGFLLFFFFFCTNCARNKKSNPRFRTWVFSHSENHEKSGSNDRIRIDPREKKHKTNFLRFQIAFQEKKKWKMYLLEASHTPCFSSSYSFSTLFLFFSAFCTTDPRSLARSLFFSFARMEEPPSSLPPGFAFAQNVHGVRWRRKGPSKPKARRKRRNRTGARKEKKKSPFSIRDFQARNARFVLRNVRKVFRFARSLHSCVMVWGCFSLTSKVSLL